MLRVNRLPVFLAGGKEISPSKINTEIDVIAAPTLQMSLCALKYVLH